MNEEHDPELSGLIRAHATRYRASPALESTVRTEIALQSAAERRPPRSLPWRWPAWGFAAAGFAGGIIVSALVVLAAGRPGDAADKLEGELVNSHVRALMANHLIDVFVWPDAAEEPRKPNIHQGYNVLGWRGAGMQYWAVSDLNAEELKTLGSLLR